MAIGRWNALCMDTTGGEALGRFWAAALGWRFEGDEECGVVGGPGCGAEVAMCLVPEEKTVKHRVHLDVHCGSVEELVAAGATPVLPSERSGFDWTVMRDPEGGEFCAFVSEAPAANRFFQLVVDAVEPDASARWWAEVLGARAVAEEDGGGWWRVLDVPDLPFERLSFQPVGEPKTVKNRVHWDVYGDTAAFLERGAVLLRRRDDEISWDVLADPAGNEFCVFTAGSSDGAAG